MCWDCRCRCSRVSWCSEVEMLELFHNLGLGFSVVFQFVNLTLPSWLGGFVIPMPMNIIFCLIGALLCSLVVVWPLSTTFCSHALLLPSRWALRCFCSII